MRLEVQGEGDLGKKVTSVRVSLSICRAPRIGLTLVLIDPKWWKHSEMGNREQGHYRRD